MTGHAPCEFPGSLASCRKCDPCLGIMHRRAVVAAPYEALIDAQSDRRCRVCDRIERYCQTDGQGRSRHAFAPRLTCESCRHMGGRYWGDDDFPKHFCHRSDERRAANFKSCGDYAEDFMRSFRTFYDASPIQSAEDCSFFEARDSGSHPEGQDRNGLGAEGMAERPNEDSASPTPSLGNPHA